MGKIPLIAFLALFVAFSGVEANAQDPLKPKEHFKIERPAYLKSTDAKETYDSIIKQMVEGYAQSGNRVAQEYRNWRQDNNAPYLSSGHGNRYLNNYGNKISQGYLKLRRGQLMPAGSVLAKDSFTVTDANDIFAGALFIMEKLVAGSNSKTADWRYLMIMPDGSLFGDSAEAGNESMQFCHDCHNRAKHRDYLYLIPGEYRNNVSN
jgi:hypothetical protein